MRTHLATALTGAVLATVIFGSSAFARDHSVLNGTWTLVPAKSDVAGQAVLQTGTVTINDRQGNITISRDFTFDGASETFLYSFSTDGRENSTFHKGKNYKSKASWEGDTLKVTTTQDGATTFERFSLAADGTLELKVDRPEHKTITLLFLHK